MVEPQSNMLYWGSQCNFQTVSWKSVDCEWGTASVYFGITYVSFFPVIHPVFVVVPSADIDFFVYVKNIMLVSMILPKTLQVTWRYGASKIGWNLTARKAGKFLLYSPALICIEFYVGKIVIPTCLCFKDVWLISFKGSVTSHMAGKHGVLDPLIARVF